jgi:uncharacterized alpha-E superfamily protein
VERKELMMGKVKLVGRKRKFVREENPNQTFREMTKHHLDVLQSIEFSVVSAWRRDERIDDKAVSSALRAAIAGTDAADELAGAVGQELRNARRLRADVSEEIWTKGLKVVLESVHNHSAGRDGDINYLSFIEPFVP